MKYALGFFRNPFILLLKICLEIDGAGLVSLEDLNFVVEFRQVCISVGDKLLLFLDDAIELLQLVVKPSKGRTLLMKYSSGFIIVCLTQFVRM